MYLVGVMPLKEFYFIHWIGFYEKDLKKMPSLNTIFKENEFLNKTSALIFNNNSYVS